MNKIWFVALCLAIALAASTANAETRTEHFDEKPANWEGVNNRSTHFAPQTVTQDFGYSPTTQNAGGAPGEVGGRIQPDGNPAFYGYRLLKPYTLDDSMSASGKMRVVPGKGNFLMGFFNAGTVNEWRTPNSLTTRINGRGAEGFHCHVEYGTSMWRVEAAVFGDMVRGERINARMMPFDTVYDWKLAYDPDGAEGRGMLTFTLNGETVECDLAEGHRADGATVTHFGLMPLNKSYDDPGEVWIDDVTVNEESFDFTKDPVWDGMNNRRTYETWQVRPNFNFGWSPTHVAEGEKAGEMGGLVYRGECLDPEQMAHYGDRLEPLSLETPLVARGKVCVTRAVTDSSASIGFYHSERSMLVNPSQDQGIPMDSLGLQIEGPSSEGFFFYPFYRTHGDDFGIFRRGAGSAAPHIYPDGKVHDWSLTYDPNGADGKGQITVTLDDESCTLDLEPDHKDVGAAFDRFGICTPWIDGNAVTVYFDDLTYTCAE